MFAFVVFGFLISRAEVSEIKIVFVCLSTITSDFAFMIFISFLLVDVFLSQPCDYILSFLVFSGGVFLFLQKFALQIFLIHSDCIRTLKNKLGSAYQVFQVVCGVSLYFPLSPYNIIILYLLFSRSV